MSLPADNEGSSAPDDPPRTFWQRNRPFFWIPTLGVICWTGTVIEQAVSWTDSLSGMRNGAVMGLFMLPLFLVLFIPLGMILAAIGSFRPLRPYRWWISLSPALIFVLSSACQRVRDRIHPELRFERFTGAGLPANTRDLVFTWEGGYFFDRLDTYSFHCDPAETDALIQSLGLEKDDGPKELPEAYLRGLRLEDAASTVLNWRHPEYWRPRRRPGGSPGRTDFLQLHTDSTHTRVFIAAGTT